MASKSRWFFAAMPDPHDLASLAQGIRDAGLVDQLARRLFPLENWHQTLSDRFWEPVAANREALMTAGGLVDFRPFTLSFKQVRWSRHELNGRNFCTVVGASGADELRRCVAAVRDALAALGLESPEGYSPHITLNYSAADVHPSVHILPCQWTIRELLLVEGVGQPYRYIVQARWPFTLPATPQGQDAPFT